MLVSVALCTWNRSALLRGALERMAALAVPPGVEWELLVVNNACTDGTDGVVGSFGSRLPIRLLHEEALGLSHARNRAVAEARGEYILWSDDDVLVEPGWLEEYARAFAGWPEAAVFGGPIEPLFEETPPAWLRRIPPELGFAYSALDLGRAPGRLPPGAIPYGANYAVRRREQSRCRYDPRLGRKGEGLMGGEETVALGAMLNAGALGVWVPGAKVRHFVPKSRQTLRWLRRRCFGLGQTQGQFAADQGGWKFLGRPLELWKRAIGEELRYRLRRRGSEPEVWIRDLYSASYQWGFLRDWNRLGLG